MPAHEIISRKDAKAKGLAHYFTGKPCKHGHTDIRRSTNGLCRACERHLSREQARRECLIPAKREKRLASTRKTMRALRANPETREILNASKRQWRRSYYEDEDNRGRYNAIARQRYAEDPLKDINKVHRRRMKHRSAGGSFTDEDIAQIYRQQRGRCAYCRVALRGKFQIDHIDPHGGNDPANLQLTCRTPLPGRPRCNQSKGAKDAVTWVREEFGRLL